MPVLDMLSLTKALLYPNDRTAWLSLLRAPWCGLHMSDLLHISQYTSSDNKTANNNTRLPLLLHSLNNPDALTALSATGQEKIQRLMGVINSALAQQKRLSLRRWVQGIWYSLGGAGLLLNPNDSANINTFFDLLNKYEQGGGIPQWDDLEQAVTELFAKPLIKTEGKTEEKTEKAADVIPPVEIMTVHKSKGLEFDTVILPALDKKTGMNDKELMVWLERVGYSQRSHRQEQQLLISPVHAVGADNDKLYSFIKQQLKDKEKIEADRLLYVACTRAIKQLHLIGYVAVNSDENKIENKNDSESSSIPQQLIAH
jgi:ATP-dependent exoDNAse (exonuclease V) beta subunit